MTHWVLSHLWFLFIIVWLAGWGLTTVQVRHYREFLKSIRSQPHAGRIFATGIGKSWIGRGCVVGVMTDHDGYIVDAYRMSGRSVFARFHPWPDILGRNIAEWAYPQSKKATSADRAMAQAAELSFRQWASHAETGEALTHEEVTV